MGQRDMHTSRDPPGQSPGSGCVVVVVGSCPVVVDVDVKVLDLCPFVVGRPHGPCPFGQ